jgi:hypothetical protein
MLNLFKKKEKLPIEELKEVERKAIDEAIKRAARLKKVSLDNYSGWKDFCELLDNYVDTMLENKKKFNLSTASAEEIHRLSLYDRDVWLISNIIRKIPENFVLGIEQRVKKEEKENGAADK